MLDSSREKGCYPSAEGESRPREGLVSLAMLLKFYANAYADMIASLQKIETLCENVLTPQEGAGKVKPQEDKLLGRIRRACVTMELTTSLKLVDRILAEIRGGEMTTNEFCKRNAELRDRIMDEADSRSFFYAPPDEAKFYGLKNAFGQEVTAAFPRATIDIEEAGNCLSLSRHTASVLHLMRVMESGAFALAASLGLAYEFRGWDAIIKKISAELQKKYDDMDATMKGKKDFYANALDRFVGAKDAIRNPTMHGRVHYDQTRAEEVYRNVASFMKKLAEELKERGDAEEEV